MKSFIATSAILALAATSAAGEADPQYFTAGGPSAVGYGNYGYPLHAGAPLTYTTQEQKEPSGFYYHVQTVDTVKPKTIEVPTAPVVTAPVNGAYGAFPGYHYGYNGGAFHPHAGAYSGAPFYNGAYAHPGYGYNGYNGGLLPHGGFNGYPAVRYITAATPSPALTSEVAE